MTTIETGGYRSGKTMRHVTAMPDGSIYVVLDGDERRYVRDLLRHLGRDPDTIKLVTVDDVGRGALRGLPRETIMSVDHAVWDEGTNRDTWTLLPWRDRFAALEGYP